MQKPQEEPRVPISDDLRIGRGLRIISQFPRLLVLCPGQSAYFLPPPRPLIWPPHPHGVADALRRPLLPGPPSPQDAPGHNYSAVFLEEVPSVSPTPPAVNLARKQGNALWNIDPNIRSRSHRSRDDSRFGAHFIPKGKSMLFPRILWHKLQRFRKSKNKCFPSAELSQGANPQLGFNFLSCNAFYIWNPLPSLLKLPSQLDLCLMEKLSHKRSSDVSKVTHTVRKGAGILARVSLPLLLL